MESTRRQYLQNYYQTNRMKIKDRSQKYYWNNRQDILAKNKAKKEQSKLQPINS